MLPTGDVKGGIRKLESLIRTIKYAGAVSYSSLSSGDPAALLPIVSYTLTSFSPVVAELLVTSGFELSGKTDLRFTETVYKVLRDAFQYKPVLTKEQFLQWGFSQRKISVVCDIISLVLQKHDQLMKRRPKPKGPASQKSVRVETISFSDPESAVPAKPTVINHLQNPEVCSGTPPSEETVKQMEQFSCRPPGRDVIEVGGAEQEDASVRRCCAELQGRLSALETRIQGLVSGLDRLCILEKHLLQLQTLETSDRSEDQTIAVSRGTWENLLSRVLLLETKLELNSTEENIPPQSPPSPSSSAPRAFSRAPQVHVGHLTFPKDSGEKVTLPEPDDQGDLKERLERITNMLKSTSSLLKSTGNGNF